MSDAFNTALQQAKQMYRPERQDISVVEIQLGMAGGGGLYPLIKRSSGSNISTGSLGSRDAGGSGPWDAWSPPDEPRIQYQPVPQQATVPDMSSGMMRSYFQNLVGEEEEGYNPLYRKEGGGLSSIQKQINIGGEPHRLSYINSDEASLLRQMGGSGKSVNGVPAYFWDVGDDLSGAGWDVGKDTDIGTGKDEGGNNISRDDKPKSPGFVETVLQHFLPVRMTPRELEEEEERLAALKNSTPENPLYQEPVSDMHQRELMPHHRVSATGDTARRLSDSSAYLGASEKSLIDDVQEFYSSMTRWDRDRDSMVDALNELKSLKDVKRSENDWIVGDDLSPEGEFYGKGEQKSSSINLLNKLLPYREPPIQEYPSGHERSSYGMDPPRGPGRVIITPDRIPAREGIWMDVLRKFREGQ